MKDILIIGAASPDILKLIDCINKYKKQYKIIGFLERDVNLIGKRIHDYQVLGTDELLLTDFKNYSVINNVLGTTKIRDTVTKRLKEELYVGEFPNIIHPLIDCNYTIIGEGNIIYESQLGADVKIGNFNIMYYGSIIGHEAIIGDCNLIAANTLIGARTIIGNRVYISNSSTVSLGINICDDVFIGVGSVVVKSIKRPKKVFGNPAKEIY